MPGWMIAINILLILNCIVLIVSVLMQEGSKSGLGAIGGGAETFFGKTKARGYEAKLEMITKVGATTFIVLAVLMTTLNARVLNPASSSSSSTASPTNMPAVSDILGNKDAGDVDLTLPEATPAPEATDEAAAPDVTVEPKSDEATEAPTAVPTEAPTAVPTEAPTAAPTEAPTAAPSPEASPAA